MYENLNKSIVRTIVVQLRFRWPQSNDHWKYNNHLRHNAARSGKRNSQVIFSLRESQCFSSLLQHLRFRIPSCCNDTCWTAVDDGWQRKQSNF